MALPIAAATLGAGALSAAGGAIGSMYAANKSAGSAKKANALNAIMAYELQERQENFEKWKLANSYQETMKDMQKAGINPKLGLSNNGATSAGSIGSSFAGAQQGDFSSLGNLGNSLNTLGQSIKTAKQLDQQDSQIEINRQQALSNINKQEAETINIIKEGKWIDPKNKKALEEAESRILNNSSQSAKNNAITQKTIEETNQIRNGLVDKLMGTNPTMIKGLVNSVGMLGVGSVMGGALKGIQAIKKARTAKQFGQFLNSIGK